MTLTINGCTIPAPAQAVSPHALVSASTLGCTIGHVLYWIRARRLGKNEVQLALTPDGNAVFVRDPDAAHQICTTINQAGYPPPGWEAIAPRVMGIRPRYVYLSS